MSNIRRDQVIAGEQKAVDRAYDCYDARLAEMNGGLAATAAASGKDSVANRIDAEEKAAAYGGLGGESLVFARVDAPEGAGAEPRPWYVGRRAVSDVRTRDTVVVLWTSPLATKWLDAPSHAPGSVILRRQLRCVQRIVEDYVDDIAQVVPVTVPAPARAVPAPPDPVLSGLPKPRAAADDVITAEPVVAEPATAEPAVADPVIAGFTDAESAEVPHADDAGAPAPALPRVPQATRRGAAAEGQGRPPARTPADVARPHHRHKKPLQPDDFLLRELQRSRSGRMRDIVETIRRDQMDLVTGSPSDILVVQGGPGTGKSAVGLHRVTWLVNNKHFKAQDILVIGPHQRFLDYVGQVLPTLGTRDVNAVQLSRLWDGGILGTDTPRARLVKSDERMAAVLRRRVEHECRPEALDGLLTAPSFDGDEPTLAVTAGGTTLRIPRSEVHALCNEARDAGGAYRARRDRFRVLLVDRLLRELTALAPRRGADGTIRRSLERNSRVERLVERVWPSPGARETLRSLYDTPDLLRACADGILDERDRATLYRARADKAQDDPWTLEDRVCLEELRYLIAGETPRRYGHIVVDEAQDLTPMQARALRRRIARGGSMTVLGDLAQATGPYPYTGWDRLGALLSDHGDWRVEELTTSYRVPAEIMEFVAPLAHTIAPSLPYPQAVREAGADAVRTVATEPWKLLDDAVAQAVRLVGTSDGSTLRSVAVIVPDDSDWLDEIGRHLDEADGITEQERAAVSVLAAAQAKGMEYDHVLVVEPATIADRGASGLRQLYIALTRSTQSLTVLHTAPLPEALTDTSDTTEQPLRRLDTNAHADAAHADAAHADAAHAGTGTGIGTASEPVESGDIPEIGTDIRVRVIGHTTGGNFKVEAVSPTTDRPLLMAVRHGSTPPAAGKMLDAWVLRHASSVSFVTVDDRGRRPISPTMATRYADALGVVAELAGGNVPGDVRARLSELKGMANRCLRLDQNDWLDVWRVLGSPDRPRLNLLRDLAANANRALAAGTPDLDRFRAELERSGWAGDLAEARRTIERRINAAAGPASEGEQGRTVTPHRPTSHASPATSATPTPSTLSAPSAPSTHSAAPAPSEPEETEPMTTTATAATAPEKEEPSAGLLHVLQATAAADRTCKTHEAVRLELKAALLRADRQPQPEHPVVDVNCVAGQGHLLYEVLGVGLTAYADLRSGAARLHEINHTLPAPADRLCLVLAGPPAEDWSAATIHDVFGVHVLWRTQQGWAGQDLETALGIAQG